MNMKPIKSIRLNAIIEVVEIPKLQQAEYKTVIRDGDKYYTPLGDFVAYMVGLNPDIIDTVNHNDECLTILLKKGVDIDPTIYDWLSCRLTDEFHAEWWITTGCKTVDMNTPYEHEEYCLAIKVRMAFEENPEVKCE